MYTALSSHHLKSNACLFSARKTSIKPLEFLKVTMKKDNLTRIKYIGPARLKLLKKNGITTIAKLHQTPVQELAGIKSFGAMAAGEKPEIGELLNAIQISSGDDHVKIYAEIPEELIKKLQADKPEEEEEIN